MSPKPAALGGAADPVSGAAAVLVDPRDPKEAARALLAVRDDGALRSRLTEEGRRFPEEYYVAPDGRGQRGSSGSPAAGTGGACP